jgi:aminoglycoside 6'-N-acetyltransferase
MRESDLPLLHEWLQRPHVKRWWRDSDTLEETVAHYTPALRGEEPSDHYVIVVDGHDAGMIQTYLAADYPEWGRFVDDSESVAGVDVLIGEEELTGRGLGPRVLGAFVRDVVFVRPGVRACAATLEPANHRSRRAFEQAGFREVGDVVEDGQPHVLLRLDRDA